MDTYTVCYGVVTTAYMKCVGRILIKNKFFVFVLRDGLTC